MIKNVIDVLKKNFENEKDCKEFLETLEKQLRTRKEILDFVDELVNGKSDVNINLLAKNHINAYTNEKDNVYGFYDKKKKKIYINLTFALNDFTQTLRTIAHEKTHEYTNNEMAARNNEIFAINTWNLLNGKNKINKKESLKKNLIDSLKNVTASECTDVKDRANRTIFVHGTFSDKTTFKDSFVSSTLDMINDKNYDFLNWSGGNTKIARKYAAKDLLKLINENYDYKEGEIINLVGHSHGGNVIKEFTNIYDNDYEIRILNYATPNRNDYKIDDEKLLEFYNIYHKDDNIIQGLIGGFDFWDVPVRVSKVASETYATNIEVHNLPTERNILGLKFSLEIPSDCYSAHTKIHTKETNDMFVRSGILSL